jgi:CheY-like chemotaxis protein
MLNGKFSVLVVDDCEDDRLFIRRAIRKSTKLAIVNEAADGAEAIAYLAGKGEFGNRIKHPFPDVVLLDLKMPRISGHEVLAWLCTQTFDELFVVVLSGSFLTTDVSRSMELGADAYFQKSPDPAEQEVMIEKITQLLDKAGSGRSTAPN